MATVTAALQAPLTPALFPDASEWKTSGPPLSAEQLKGLCLGKDVPSLVLYEPRSGSPVQGILTPTPLPLPGVGGRPAAPLPTVAVLHEPRLLCPRLLARSQPKQQQAQRLP